jgi:hypothetical protein
MSPNPFSIESNDFFFFPDLWKCFQLQFLPNWLLINLGNSSKNKSYKIKIICKSNDIYIKNEYFYFIKFMFNDLVFYSSFSSICNNIFIKFTPHENHPKFPKFRWNRIFKYKELLNTYFKIYIYRLKIYFFSIEKGLNTSSFSII